MTRGFDQPLYVLPFDHRGSFQTKMFGWHDPLSAEQTAEFLNHHFELLAECIEA